MAFQAASKWAGTDRQCSNRNISGRVLGDPQRLRQCLVNLVSNAIKFTKQGEIVIEVRSERRTAHGPALTDFEVRDTGMGIAEKTLDLLFQPFVQADSSTTRHFGGTGLGLSIVRELVELMGGEIGVSSKWASVQNSSSRCRCRRRPSISPRTQAAREAGGRILIVDDNVTNQRVLSAQLVHAGYTVTTVSSGAAALHEAANAVDLARISSTWSSPIFKCPTWMGRMLGERIIAMPGLANTRLVMLTSLDRHGDTPRLGGARIRRLSHQAGASAGIDRRGGAGDERRPRQWQMETQPMITLNMLDASRRRKQRFAGHGAAWSRTISSIKKSP